MIILITVIGAGTLITFDSKLNISLALLHSYFTSLSLIISQFFRFSIHLSKSLPDIKNLLKLK